MYFKKKPVRTCVICKNKIEKRLLLRMIVLENKLIFDMNQGLQDRGYYVCDNNLCLLKLGNWLKRRNKWLKKEKQI